MKLPIFVSIQKGHLSIIGNYFEQNGICANIQGLSPDLSSVSFSNNFFHENVVQNKRDINDKI